MKIIDAIKDFFKRFKNKQLDEGETVGDKVEDTSTEVNGNQGSGISIREVTEEFEKKDPLGYEKFKSENGFEGMSSEEVAEAVIQPVDFTKLSSKERKIADGWKELTPESGRRSYTERLAELVDLAKEYGRAPVGLDFEKILMGAVMEEKGASRELMELYSSTDSYATETIPLEPKYWKSHLTQEKRFDHFIIPAGEQYEPTVEGIKKRIEELRRNIEISQDGKEFSTGAEFIDEDRTHTSDKIYRENLKQRIRVGEEGRVEYTFNEHIYISDPDAVDERGKRIQFHPNRIISNEKYLERKNGKDVKLVETETGNQFEKDNIFYVVEDKDGKVKVTVGRSADERSVNTQSYEQKNVDSYLDESQGLGFFKQNPLAKRIRDGEFKENPELLREELKKRGLDAEEPETER